MPVVSIKLKLLAFLCGNPAGLCQSNQPLLPTRWRHDRKQTGRYSNKCILCFFLIDEKMRYCNHYAISLCAMLNHQEFIVSYCGWLTTIYPGPKLLMVDHQQFNRKHMWMVHQPGSPMINWSPSRISRRERLELRHRSPEMGRGWYSLGVGDEMGGSSGCDHRVVTMIVPCSNIRGFLVTSSF